MIHVVNDAGRRFQVRCIKKGSRYGLNNCLVHDEDDPIVEFTDVTPGKSGLASDSVFVARYAASTLLAHDAGADLWMFGSNVAWRLGFEQIRQVLDWIKAGAPE
jgi:hypothetical protein